MTAATATPVWRPAAPVGFAAPLPAVDLIRVAAADDGWTVSARVVVDSESPNLAGHFPGQPIYPGVFVVETLCQAMAQAVPGAPRLRTVTSVRFLAALLGGDEMTLDLDVRPATPAGWAVRGTARRLDGTVTAQLRAVFDAGAGA
ncbi:hypothetical protein JMF97_26960 [Micromonospora fiedleri]|uniref:ApeI dehydratase-like domain-containing protein n=1 Tax=Micromonospora fiedleri TaxID=1157498 RepID=A0ABS1UWX0_9ACTN|nr:hypothetical protein [Micromonospora fiedleri]MBL6279801.1 hypothetical protein [Micromonospora fiedleri]